MKSEQLPFKSAFLLAVLLSILSTHEMMSQSTCHEINFENIPNEQAAEGLIVGDQFLSTHGLSFILEDGTLPTLSEVGNPATAFGSFYGPDTPIQNQNNGSFFLTDDGVLEGLEFYPVIINISTAADSISGEVLDVDFEEQMIIQASNEFEEVIQEVIINAVDPNTGDGISTPWEIKREQFDVHSIRIEGNREEAGAFGLAFDNLVICSLDDMTSAKDYNRKYLSIFPNLASASFEIQSSEQIESIRILDTRGQNIYHSLFNEGNIVRVDCDYVGLVLVQIDYQDRRLTKKVSFF